MVKKTVVFYTLQTCGTGSSWRIMRTLNQNERTLRPVGQERFAKGWGFEFDWSEIPAEGHLYQINCHYSLTPIDDLKGQQFIVNFRDPRDRLCNEFMWNMSHPLGADDTKERIEARAAKLRETGVDAWLRERIGGELSDRDYYQYMIRNAERIPVQDRLVNTYARLCLDFDSFIDRTASWLDLDLTPELKQAVERERTDNLQQNPAWSGHHLEGADLAPGRYKRELQPESIQFLSKHYAPVLRAMARLDPDYAPLYLENVDDEWGREPFPPTMSFFGQDHAHRAMMAAKAAKTPPPPPPVVPSSPAVPVAKKSPPRPSVVRHTVIDRPDLRIDHFRNSVRSDTVVFSFTERTNRDLAQPGFGTEFLLRNGMDVIAIKTNRDIWYENFQSGDVAEIERWLSWASAPYRRRLGYGSSMGAYAAIRFSKALKLDRVLAISPLFDIKQPWDTRWKSDLAEMSADIGMMTLPAEGAAGGEDGVISDTAEYMMIFDPKDVDGEHIRLFQKLISAEKLKLLPLPFAGHPAGQYLLQLKILGELGLHALRQGVFPNVTEAKRLHKAKSTIYLYELARHCMQRGHMQWALSINKRLLALKDDPEFHMQACKIWDALGETGEALAAVDRALISTDHIFHANYARYKDGILARQAVLA